MSSDWGRCDSSNASSENETSGQPSEHLFRVSRYNWLLERQESIEQALARKHLSAGTFALDLAGATLTDTRGADVEITLGSHAFDNNEEHRVDGSQTVAAVDLSGAGSVDIVAAKRLHYALGMRSVLGDGSEDSGDARVRAKVLGSLVHQANDAQWRGMLRAAQALVPILAATIDPNADGSVDENNAALFYYAQALPAALGDGSMGSGDTHLRTTILGPLYPGADDTALLRVLEDIRRFGETP